MDAWKANALIGARLGSSTLERTLGIGGMGAVYLARQERPRRHVAVKVLRPSVAADEDAWELFLARFRREADAAAALDHANIVPIFEFGEQGSLAYIVMPYLSDGSLANFLAPDARLSLSQVASFISQAAAALDYAHQHGIVHRDVKPSNLLLHPDGRLMLGDFGIARPLNMADFPAMDLPFEGGDLTVSGAAMGTPEYMAPEQVSGDPVSAATDTYALGVVAYTLLTGHTPFEASDVNQILISHLTKTPPSLRSIRRDIPRDVEEAILWAMAKDPSHRPGSSGAFARAFHAASTGVPAAVSGRAAEQSRPRSLFAAGAPQSFGNAAPPALASMSDAGGHGPDRSRRGSLDGSDAPTLYDGGFRGGRGGFDAPPWPATTPPGGPPPSRPRRRIFGLLALLGTAGVLLVTMAVVLASGSLQSLLNANPNNTGDVVPTATTLPTATPSPSPTPVVNWLRVSKDQVTFGCHKGQRTDTIILNNLAQDTTGWTATVDKNFGSGTVTLQPDTGELVGGKSKTITLSYSGFATFPLNGTVTFTPTNDAAGQAPTVAISAPACVGASNDGNASLSPQHHVQPQPPQPKHKKHGNGGGSGHGGNGDG